MGTQELYHIRFNNHVYNLGDTQVNELLKIRESRDSETEIIIKLKNTNEVIGTVIDLEGFNPLSPFDVYIPVFFRIRTSEKIIELNFLEVESIELKN